MFDVPIEGEIHMGVHTKLIPDSLNLGNILLHSFLALNIEYQIDLFPSGKLLTGYLETTSKGLGLAG